MAVGDTTGGGGGAGSNHSTTTVSDFILPSGKMVSTPTGYFERYDGQPIEWLGVLPDIRVAQTAEDIRQGRDKQLEYAIEFLK
jgi:C-terminal processing protease CtpA/Prc